MIKANLHPAYLWIGSSEVLKNNLNLLFKKVFCKNYIAEDACNTKSCIECSKIDVQQHHNIRYLTPEKNQYTVSELDIIFDTIVYSLAQDEHFFFVIDKAELLNLSCANKLLKSLEEPPAGYHFILLAQTENLLPTIVSRCVKEIFKSNDNTQNLALFKHFTLEYNLDFDQFALDLAQNKIPESEILNLVDDIYNYWHKKLNLAIIEANLVLINKAKKVIALLDFLRKHPPMPGSSIIFLKNLYTQFIVL